MGNGRLRGDLKDNLLERVHVADLVNDGDEQLQALWVDRGRPAMSNVAPVCSCSGEARKMRNEG